MRIATYESNGQRRVGIVSADGLQVMPLQLSPEQAHIGALALIT